MDPSPGWDRSKAEERWLMGLTIASMLKACIWGFIAYQMFVMNGKMDALFVSRARDFQKVDRAIADARQQIMTAIRLDTEPRK